MRDIFHSEFFRSQSIFSICCNIIVVLCVLFIFLSILIDFSEFHKKKNVKKEKKSIVETGTMFLFFLLYYLVIKTRTGTFIIENRTINICISSFGLLLIILGCFVNIKGRLDLKSNWSNQIKVYTDHSLVTSGIYHIVRHPLYASLIWMFAGGAFLYLNYLAFILNAFIFLPFMYYRAKQEEKILIAEFEAYKTYQSKTGMFFPKLF
jgi:protein-S-isoprenylcysteine O-methyltransferase Ste14